MGHRRRKKYAWAIEKQFGFFDFNYPSNFVKSIGQALVANHRSITHIGLRERRVIQMRYFLSLSLSPSPSLPTNPTLALLPSLYVSFILLIQSNCGGEHHWQPLNNFLSYPWPRKQVTSSRSTLKMSWGRILISLPAWPSDHYCRTRGSTVTACTWVVCPPLWLRWGNLAVIGNLTNITWSE